MATCNVQSLLDAATCFECGGNARFWDLFELQLLCQIKAAVTPGGTPMASCNVQDLMDGANCFNCLMPAQVALVKLKLLCDILAGIMSGGGTGVAVYKGLGNPNGVQVGNEGDIYSQLDGGGALWTKLAGTGNGNKLGWTVNT